MARKQQPPQTAPDLPPEKAYTALNRQLEKLKQFNGRRYEQMKAEETEWQQFTEKLVIRSFGSDSPNHTNFRNALFAGEHYIQMWGNEIRLYRREISKLGNRSVQRRCGAAYWSSNSTSVKGQGAFTIRGRSMSTIATFWNPEARTKRNLHSGPSI